MKDHDPQNLWDAYHASRSVADRNRLVEHYTPYAHAIARAFSKAFTHATFTPEDAKNEAVIGLIDAIERFTPSRTGQFSDYASVRIRGAVIDASRRLDWRPRSAVKFSKAGGETVKILNGEASDVLPWVARDDQEIGWEIEAQDGFDHLLKGIKPRNREIMEMLFVKEMNQYEIADEIGMHQGWVSVIRNRSIEFIRESIRERGTV